MFGLKRTYYQNKTIEELIALYRINPNGIIFSILYERYSHLVFGTCLKYLKNKQDAEDVTMHLFEHLSEKLLRYDISNFKSWLYMVCKNECFMLLRKRNPEWELIANQLIEVDELENSKLTETHFELLEKAILELKEEQKICIELFYLQQLSYQKISEQLGISLKNVKSAIQNGKRNLKIRLEESHVFKK
jgi:RNA polymerase sigma factor (sigma-70 family)